MAPGNSIVFIYKLKKQRETNHVRGVQVTVTSLAKHSVGGHRKLVGTKYLPHSPRYLV
jgi:hypothetical protein